MTAQLRYQASEHTLVVPMTAYKLVAKTGDHKVWKSLYHPRNRSNFSGVKEKRGGTMLYPEGIEIAVPWPGCFAYPTLEIANSERLHHGGYRVRVEFPVGATVSCYLSPWGGITVTSDKVIVREVLK